MRRRRDRRRRVGRVELGASRDRRIPFRGLLIWGSVGLALVMIWVRIFWFEIIVIQSNTMAPAAFSGDLLLVSRFSEPALGEVVLLRYEEKLVMRRVLGLPGDQITSDDGVLVRNGVALRTKTSGVVAYHDEDDEVSIDPLKPPNPVARRKPRRQTELRERLEDGREHTILGNHVGAAKPWSLTLDLVEVPPGHLFLLCDNRRTCPYDETVGVLPDTQIEGIVWWVMWYGEARAIVPDAAFYGAFQSVKSVRVEEGDDGEGPEK